MNLKASNRENILSHWLSQYSGLLSKIAFTYCHNREDRNDLLQEIGLQLWRSIPNFRQESLEKTWIYRIAVNTAMMWQRKESRFRGRQQPLQDHILQANEQQSEELDWLYAEIRKLDKIDRSLLLMHLEGMKYREIADILGITESNTGVRLNRIKKHLISRSKEI